MAFRVLSFVGLFALLLPFVTASHLGKRHHQEVAHRARGDVDIHKRQAFVDVRLTWYDVGLGACGSWSKPSDFIVALNIPQFGSGYPGPQCFKQITIQFGGKTAVATILDKCEICPYGGLDLSEGLFSYFASTGVGVLTGTWWFNGDGGGGGGGTTSTTWDQPTTTSTSYYTPTSTSSTPDWTPTSSSTTAYTPTTSTTSTAWTTSSSSTTTSSTSSSSSTTPYNSNTQVSGLAVPTGGEVSTPSTSNPENILVVNEILVEVGLLLIAEKRE